MRLLERFPLTTFYLILLAVVEAPLITILVLPYNSTYKDWLITALLIAPVVAGAVLLLIALPVRVVDAVVAAVLRMRRN